MKKVLIISNSYPYFGGQSTTAYNLLKLLKKRGYDVRLMYINQLKKSNADPDQTGVSHKIVLRKNLIHKLYHWIRDNNTVDFDSQIKQVKNYYFLLRVFPRLLFFLSSRKFTPDLVITNIPSYYWILKKIFGSKKVLVVIGSSPEMNKIAKFEIDASTVLASDHFTHQALHKANKADFSNATILFNSALTRKIYQSLHIPFTNSFVQYFNLMPQVAEARSVPFPDRKYDLIYIASDFSRKIKNPELAFQIFSSFASAPKIVVGTLNDKFSEVNNTSVLALTTQPDILDLLSQSKVLIITSYFDSSPSVLSEAILSGCNVLVSQNVGWSEVLDKRCVVQSYNDVKEWTAKAAALISEKIDYSAFEQVIKNAEENIVRSIETLF